MLSFVGLSSSFAAPSRAAAATRCRAAQAVAAPQLREYEYDGWKLAYRHKPAAAGREGDAPLLLVVGYPVLMLADVGSVVSFGLLTTVAAAAALFADLVVLPLLLRLVPGRIDR